MGDQRSIMLLFSQKENIRILTEFLSPKFSVEACGGVDELGSCAPDLIIADGVMMTKFSKALENYKAAQSPLALPILLETPRHDINMATSFLWKVADNLIFMPIEKIELLARIEVLLRNRELSILARKPTADVSNLRRDKKLLRKSEKRFRTIFESSMAIMIPVDPASHHIVACNKAAIKFYGWKRHQLERMIIDEINVLSQTEIKAEMELARRSQRNFFQFMHRRATGDIRNVEVYSGKVIIDGKELLHSVIHDVSEKVQAEEQLRISRERFRLAQDISPDGFTILHLFRNEEGRVVDFS